MPTYEVFLKSDGKDEYRHAGALEAANDDLAVILARECYVRRGEGDRIWLVDRTHVVEPDEGYLLPNADKPHRDHGGEAVAAPPRSARPGGTDTEPDEHQIDAAEAADGPRAAPEAERADPVEAGGAAG